MRLKFGVRLTDLAPQMALGAVIIDGVFGALDPYCSRTVTSGNDSKHSAESLHYKGRALDWRTKDFRGSKQQLRDEVKAALGDDFDVVLEAESLDNEHLHTEYDPK